MTSATLMDSLARLLEGKDERVGFVLKTGEIVEVENICPDKDNGFEVRGEDLMKYAVDAEASWHTHPGHTKCLSANDHYAFLNYPHLKHYIVGTDGVECYVVKNGIVVIAS